MTLHILRRLFCVWPFRQILTMLVQANAPTMPGG